MATHRHPKGVFIRPEIDFFSDRIGLVAGAWIRSGTPNFFISHWWLLNDSNTGQFLHVWNSSTVNNGAGLAIWQMVSGHGGSFVAQGKSAFSNGPGKPGQLFLDLIDTGSVQPVDDPAFTLPISSGVWTDANPGATTSFRLQNVPMIIAPGDSIYVFFDGTGRGGNCSFQYAVLPGVN